jgi:hypothetical protein
MRPRIGADLAHLPGLCLLGLAALVGCATVTRGASQNTTIVTDPPGAGCVFRRADAVIGVVNPTPGTLSIVKGHTPIEVSCTKDGYAEASGSIGAHFEPMSIGNILLGGVIGIVVDATSGATAAYEPNIALTMVPLVFPDTAARDAFFAERRSAFRARARRTREQIAASCPASDCNRLLVRADDAERAGLTRIDTEFQSARTGS